MTLDVPARSGSDLLWTPKAVGRVEIRNRFVLTGHGTGMVSDGQAGSQMVDYYAERARGGVGLIMLGTQQVHRTSPGLGHLLMNLDDRIIPSLRGVAQAVHGFGARIFGYIGHFGAQAETRPEPPWSASALYDADRGEFSHAMSEADMAEIVAAHAAAAARNIEAGLDGIEVHGGHGLLLHQFLSPWSNKRTDAYGGSLDNRLRFPSAVIRAVRARIGPDVPLGMRLSGEEAVPGGLTLADMKLIVPRLVEAGALDYVDVSAGNDRHAVSNMLHHPPMGLPPAPYAAAARAIRAAIDVPVIHGTRIASAAVAADLLASGAADFAGFCRALIADPHLPNKIRAGQTKDIVPCVACEQACIGHLHRGRSISCIGNPATGREAAWRSIGQASRPRRVVVVGAGPAGLEAAWIAAARGHDVILLERDAAPGGLLQLAALAPGRAEWLDLVQHKRYRLERYGVEQRLGRPATPRDILALAPDTVILATGSATAERAWPDLKITGLDLPHVVSHRTALADAAAAGGAGQQGRLLVLDFDNHQQGVGTALALAARGAAVTIATAGPRVGHRLEPPNLTRSLQLMAELGVATVTDFALAAIEPQRVRGSHRFGGRQIILDGFEGVVVAAPGRPLRGLVAPLEGRVAHLALVGDCRTPRDVEAAILDANSLARTL